MTIILQPCYSGDWINTLEKEGKNIERNRIIITGEIKSSDTADERYKTTIFDKCNKNSITDNDKWYFYDTPTALSKESYSKTKSSLWKYFATDYANSINDKIYEISHDDTDSDYEFYENPDDEGPEFVSGIIESYHIDRDYYYYDSYNNLQHHQTSDTLDADENDDPEITVGDSNYYVSCKECYYFMLNWHIGYRLGKPIRGIVGDPSEVKNPWYDQPQIRYTRLEEGNNYIF